MCVVLLAMWGVSLFWIAGISVIKASVVFGEGGLAFIYYTDSWWGWDRVFAEPVGWTLTLGFYLPYVVEEPNLSQHVLDMPFWLLLTIAAIPTAVLWRRDRRTVKPGHCRQCGYDLRASKKMCPECGTAITPERR